MNLRYSILLNRINNASLMTLFNHVPEMRQKVPHFSFFFLNPRNEIGLSCPSLHDLSTMSDCSKNCPIGTLFHLIQRLAPKPFRQTNDLFCLQSYAMS